MDSNRINKTLKLGLDQATRSLELNKNDFLNRPELVQTERKDFTLNNPVGKPDTIDVWDIFIPSSESEDQPRLHIYQSKNFNPDRIILYFHGGGYVFGLPEQVDPQMYMITEKLNCTLISVDNRLSPQHLYPKAIEDGLDALNWLMTEGNSSLGIHPDRITVYGGSAGAHLAGRVAQIAVQKEIANINHQFLLYPVINFRLDSASMDELFDAPLWNKAYAEIAKLHFFGKDSLSSYPIDADLDKFSQLSKLPKTTLVACELDPLRDEAIAYAQLLYQAQVSTELWVIPGAVHVFDVFPSELQEEYHRFLLSRLKKGFEE